MTANDIRNIALLGHGGSGKTSLAEQMLFMTKGTDRLGRTADGNTTSGDKLLHALGLCLCVIKK